MRELRNLNKRIKMKTVSFNETENIIQNYCVTFTHNFNHRYSRIKNSFVIKGTEVTKEKALKIAEILFPSEYTDIIIESIDNDELTLTPSEYDFLHGMVRDQRQSSLRAQEHRIREGIQKGPLTDTEYDTYLLNLIKKMKARMNQFPVYHS